MEIMRKYLLLASVVLFQISLFAQLPDSKYENGDDSLVFSNSSLLFRVSGFGGLTNARAGEGRYEIIDDFLLVHTSDYSGEKTIFQEIESTMPDTSAVRVVCRENFPVRGVLIKSKNKSGKTIDAQVTDDDGRIFLKNLAKITSIEVSAMGYHSILFDYNIGKHYLITIAKDDIIENRSVLFKLEMIDDSNISLLLLTDNFNNEKNRDTELKKHDKRATKSNIVPKRYSKRFGPFSR